MLLPPCAGCSSETIEILHLQLTPLRVVCLGVFTEKTSRLTRRFAAAAAAAAFARVSLAEETGARLYLQDKARPVSRQQVLQQLGLASASPPGLFSRQFGICVSSTTPTLRIPTLSIHLGPDITSNSVLQRSQPQQFKPKRGQIFCFTEGCGYMSARLWRRLGDAFPQLRRCSAVQMRLGGLKGMLVLHPAFPPGLLERGQDIMAHASMAKFAADAHLQVRHRPPRCSATAAAAAVASMRPALLLLHPQAKTAACRATVTLCTHIGFLKCMQTCMRPSGFGGKRPLKATGGFSEPPGK
ncbi:LOW QUALITY PROTEIN: RNA dependent RNA polymerase domain-containing protein, putative [Eimeria necatrix]|uniref:RNA-dependent RNA polymerase n=1 Tax=Eimeria necatrix TaxID=51315 RepID=U6MIS5_9EIME|nr:LOW QUALITY PROTEIN: RNA dependent RNA polymerase domain-containing protein, putative [Eimeria necatrix]CDJ64127.1 RNA dependent RNA polymerase domain-containing protein, putative [Eimeria necatrix]